jgi:hypothetical protein
MREAVFMNIPWVKVIKLENSSRSYTASVDSKYLVRNIVGSTLVPLPVSWFVRSLGEYRAAKALNRRGVFTKGSLMDKWVDEENGQPAYYVRYKYAIHSNAMQRVDRETFGQVCHEETLYILYLEDQPQVSRLDLD